MRLFPLRKKVRKTNILDVGSGARPTALIQRALDAEKKKKQRHFTAIEKNAFESEELKKELGLTQLPANSILINSNALVQIKKVKPRSQSIIFASYFLNNLLTKEKGLAEVMEFIYDSMRALKPNGRLVLVQDHSNSDLYKRIGTMFGMKGHIIHLTDKQAQASKSWAIEMRSTPEKRTEFLNDQGGARGKKKFEEEAKLGGYKEIQEISRPSIIILRKPFNETFLQKAKRELLAYSILKIGKKKFK